MPDVVVVGAGPVGLVTALMLADLGVEVEIVEKSATPEDLPRAISIVDETFRTLSRFGLAEPLLAESNTGTGSRYLGRTGQLLVASMPTSSRVGFPGKSLFDQPFLEQLLWNEAAARTDVILHPMTQAVHLEQHESGVRLRVQSAGVEKTIEASWIVGADGGRSFVREAVGIPLAGSTQVERWIVIDLLGETKDFEKFADFHCDPRRPHVVIPGINGRLRLEFMLFDEEDPDIMTTPAAIRELARPYRLDLDSGDVRRAAVYVAHRRVAQRYRAGRAFLVGDAAHLMPPFAGQGLNAGVRDAVNLGWKLAEVISGRGTDMLLDSYEKERRPHARAMVKVSGILGRIVMTRGDVASTARDILVLAANRVPSARRWLREMRFIKPPNYSSGFAIRRHRRVPSYLAHMVGKAIPNPMTVDWSGTRVSLDLAMGRSWALVELTNSLTAQVAVHPYWRDLGVPVVSLDTSSDGGGHELLPPRGTLWDCDESIARGNLPEPVVLVVRPDRYVAAAFVAADEPRVVAWMSKFLQPSRAADSRSRRVAAQL